MMARNCSINCWMKKDMTKIVKTMSNMHPKWKAWLLLVITATALYHVVSLIPILGSLLWSLTSMPFLILADNLGLEVYTNDTVLFSAALSCVYWLLVFGVLFLPLLLRGRLRLASSFASVVIALFHVAYSWHAWKNLPL